MLLSIITATYNRAYCLGNIYDSLKKNKFNDEIEWILIDDGSSDNTEELVENWLAEDIINIRFFKKKNGGKTSAIYYGFNQNPKGEYTLVLDSDDYLSDNCIEIIKQNLLKISNRYIGIIGLKAYTNGKIVGEKFPTDESSYIDLYFGRNSIKSDKLFVIRTEIYKNNYSLPFEGEKFLPDNVPYIKMNDLGLFKLINQIFYYGDYMEDGMTKNVFKMAMNNINGYIYEKKLLQEKKMPFKSKVIVSIKYIYYSILGNRNFTKIISYSKEKVLTSMLYLPVYIILYNRRKKMLNMLAEK